MAARSSVGNVQSTNFMKDGFQREDDSALKFFIQHKDEFLSDEACGPDAIKMRRKLARIIADQERSYALAKEGEERMRRAVEESAKREKERRKNLSRKSPDLSAVNMRPVSPKTRALLYDGVSHEGEGRALYLNTRYEKAPEDKFPMKYPTSWDLGWHFRDSIQTDEVRSSRFARRSIIETTFFTRTGVPKAETYDTSSRVWYR
ncbi:unnamed protein product [Dibothriocephalus latus]|uniref:Sperm microtubule inner protein 1 C-terminal domain-containing protein n=1 Tax=Dibothriocephalus latus TaxID=60516 RepID=A0A3P7LXK4_DIBLA|nr:unnamed protein product [Dibothriocephalus latus]